MPTLSVVIPAYNEQDGILQVVDRVLQIKDALSQKDFVLELLVVDDGSRDQTAAVLENRSAVRLVRHPVNRGYGAAIKTGFRCASGDYLAFLDADGTYPPESLPDLCRAAVAQQADLVIGSRMSGARSEMPLTRRVGNLAYSMLLSVISNRVIRDTTSGMRVLRREALQRLYPLPDGLDFTPTMSARALHEHLKMIEVPIPYAERLGRSKLSVVRDGVRFTNSIVWTVLTYNPVRILGYVSLALMAVALLIGLYAVGLRLGGVTTLNPAQVYALFGAVVLGFVSVSLFILGAMFNYLVALFDVHPVKRGLFGKPVFDPPLDRHFGWVGGMLLVGGIGLSVGALSLSMGGWEIARLWLYLLASAMLAMIGVQLVIAWMVMRVLEQLAQREMAAQRDLNDTQIAKD